jgi:hypothetical protein
VRRADYLKCFAKAQAAPERQKEALKQALDIRKFEIDNYWKRATYFWACIGVAYAGFFAISTTKDKLDLAVVACLGLLFSESWYLVNRGSSSWQSNWESQVDLLEDEVMGPLYKSLINRHSHDFLDLADPYAFSPSRVNTLISLLVFISWIMLLSRTLYDIWITTCGRGFPLIIAGFAIIGSGALLLGGRARSGQGLKEFEVRTRSYS